MTALPAPSVLSRRHELELARLVRKPERMISFHSGLHRFHYRVAAIVQDAGHLLLHRRQQDDFWALPGGRVNAGETAHAAIVREFREELDEQIECQRLACTGENFFEYKGELHHEIGLYFYAKLAPDSSISKKDRTHPGLESDRALEFRWFLARELASIDMRPKALMAGLMAGSLPNHFLQK